MEAAPPPRSSSRLGLLIKGGLAVGISVLALWWAFREVKIEELKQDLASTSIGIVAAYVLGQLLMHGVRVIRWWILVAPLGNPSARLVFSSASVGIPAAFFFPLRLGEFVRPVMMARAGHPFGGAMAAVAVERIADGVLNVGLFFVFLKLIPDASLPPQLVTASNAALVIFGGGVVFLVAAYLARDPVIGLVRRILNPLSEAFAEKVAGTVTTFVDGLSSLQSAPRIAGFFFTTALFWALNGAATWVLAQAYVEALPFLAGPFTIGVTVFVVTIPAGPAFAGTLELGFSLGLGPFGVGASQAAAIAVVAHVVHLVFMAAIGGVGLLAAPTRPKAAATAAGSPAEPPT